jgi:hypothetical protein
MAGTTWICRGLSLGPLPASLLGEVCLSHLTKVPGFNRLLTTTVYGGAGGHKGYDEKPLARGEGQTFGRKSTYRYLAIEICESSGLV